MMKSNKIFSLFAISIITSCNGGETDKRLDSSKTNSRSDKDGPSSAANTSSAGSNVALIGEYQSECVANLQESVISTLKVTETNSTWTIDQFSDKICEKKKYTSIRSRSYSVGKMLSYQVDNQNPENSFEVYEIDLIYSDTTLTPVDSESATYLNSISNLGYSDWTPHLGLVLLKARCSRRATH